MKILDIILEADTPVYVIGDSIAVGIKNAGNAPGTAVGGKNPTQVLGFVKEFVASGKAKGSVVILSSGASNGTFERPTGEKQNLDMTPIDQQLKLLKDAGATVVLVGTGSEKSKTVTNSLGTYFVNFKDQNINQKLASAASTYGAKFLGPLEEFDPNMNSGKGDGIHPFNGYNALFQAGSAVTPTRSSDKKVPGVAGQQDTTPTKPGKAEPLTTIDVPQGTKGPAIADMQKLLVALGYSLPKYGVDGIIGPETRGALAQFQKSERLKDNGKPTPETTAVMNKLLADHPEFSTKITKSTTADVKTRDYSQGASQYAEFATDANGEKAKAICEKFLGKEISDNEWNYLLRAIYAESTSNQNELAHVAAVMLNRARNSSTNIISVLRAPNQFQSVTGTRYDPNPSPNFTQGPSANSLGNIYKGLLDNLPSAPKDIMNFTAANREAYGKGTNVGFLDKLVASGGKQIGGTVFGTVTA